jgi:hypothetical protein
MSNNGQRWCETALWRLAKREQYAYEFGPDQMVRWAALPPVDTMEETLAWLKTAEACAALTLEGRAVTGSWKTAWAGWQPVGGEADGATRPMRLVHVCVPADAAGTGAAYVTENNCTFRVSVTPYFRQDAVAAPPAGSSGVVYRVTGERRDEITGEWQWQLERREQITTSVAARVKEEDAFKTVWQQAFYGVREGDVDDNGDAVALWNPAAQPQGTLVENVFVQKNDNCTFDIIQNKTVAKAVTAAKTERERDAFTDRETVTDRNQAEGAAEFTAAAGGLVTRQAKELNADGTFDNTRSTEQEREEASARVRVSRSGEETVTETLSRSQAAAAALPTEEEGTVDELVAEKTKGSWYDNRITRAVARLITGAERRVSRTVFETVEEGMDRNVATADKPAEIGAASGGVWHEQVFRRLAHMKWSVGLTRHTENDVAEAEVSSRRTIFETETAVEEITAGAPAAAPEAAGGVYVESRGSVTPGGKHRKRTLTTAEQHVPGAQSGVTRTPGAVRTLAGARNSEISGALGAGEYGSVRNDATPGGRLNVTKETVADVVGALLGTEYESHYLETRSERQEVVASESSAGAVLSGRTLTRASFRRTDGGGWVKTTTVRTAPAARQFTLVNHTSTSLLPPYSNGFSPTTAHTQTTLFLNASMADIQAVAEAFMANKTSFVTNDGVNWIYYYWGWETEVAFGLRPDEFGTWNGTLTMRATVVAKLTENYVGVGE